MKETVQHFSITFSDGELYEHHSTTMSPDLLKWIRSYAKKNETTILEIIINEFYKLNSKVSCHVKGSGTGGVDLRKRLEK